MRWERRSAVPPRYGARKLTTRLPFFWPGGPECSGGPEMFRAAVQFFLATSCCSNASTGAPSLPQSARVPQALFVVVAMSGVACGECGTPMPEMMRMMGGKWNMDGSERVCSTCHAGESRWPANNTKAHIAAAVASGGLHERWKQALGGGNDRVGPYPHEQSGHRCARGRTSYDSGCCVCSGFSDPFSVCASRVSTRSYRDCTSTAHHDQREDHVKRFYAWLRSSNYFEPGLFSCGCSAEDVSVCVQPSVVRNQACGLFQLWKFGAKSSRRGGNVGFSYREHGSASDTQASRHRTTHSRQWPRSFPQWS